MLEMSIFTGREDLDAVIDTLAECPEVDKEHLYLLGESQGGCVAGITAPWHETQRILKEAGFNAIRSAHNPTSRAMLEACDHYGM